MKPYHKKNSYYSSIRAVAYMTVWLFLLTKQLLYADERLLPEITLKGYLNHLQLLLVHQERNRWTPGMVTLGRVAADIFILPSLIFSVAGRGRMEYGSLYEMLLMGGYADRIDDDDGYADMSLNLWENESAIFNVLFDRLFIDYTFDQWQLRIGRHRINWGKTLAWNPNDIFNASSSFDVLYPEGPGTDALLLRRYFGAMSQAECVVAKSAESIDSTTVALVVMSNIASYDIQGFCAWMEHTMVFGGGFSGQLKGAALRGECTFFRDDTVNASIQSAVCISSDYMFPHQVWVQLSLLYNSEGHKRPKNGLESLNMKITARTLSIARWQLYTLISYPLTPLWNIQCGTLINPLDGSMLLLPLTSYNLGENITCTLQAMVQAGGSNALFGGKDHMVYGSLEVHF